MPVARAPKLLTVHLRESYAVTAARVDREAGIIYGCKIVGRTSPNTHHIPGVDGTDYTMDALREEAGLLEGMCVNVGHRPRDARTGKPLPGDRNPRDRFAWLEKVSVTESGSFGDLHFLDPTDPLAVKMFNAAERKPDAFALSHDAPTAKYEIRHRRLTIVSIPYVRSVDIVADGGTNAGLFESEQAPMPKTTIAEKWAKNLLLKPKLALLLEADDMAGGTEVTPEGDHMDDLFAAFKKLVEEDPEKAKKVLKLIQDETAPEVEDEEEDEEPGKKKPEEGEEKKKPDDEKETAAKESRELRSEVLTLRRENRLNRVALAESVQLSDVDRKAAMLLESDADVKAFIKGRKTDAKTAAGKGAPRSQAAGTASVTESREMPQTAEQQAKLLTGWSAPAPR